MSLKSLPPVCSALLVFCLAGCSGGSEAGGDQAAAAHPGERTYQQFCFSCHAAGVAGAPKHGDVEAWRPRIAKGADALLASTIEGIPPGMPPRGLCATCDDAKLAEVIDYMILAASPEASSGE